MTILLVSHALVFAMDELCTLLGNSSVWCSDENHKILCEDISCLEEILFEGNVLHRDTVASMRMRCHIYSRHVRFSHAMKRLLEEAISAEGDFAFALAMFTFCMGIQRRLMQLNRSVGNNLDPLR